MIPHPDPAPLYWRLLALGLVGTVSVMSFMRSVAGINWIVPVWGATWLAISITHSLRRAGLWPVTAAGVSLAAGGWFVFLVLFPETTFYGVPTLESFEVLRGATVSAWLRIPQVAAPVQPDAGYLSLLILGAWAASSAGAALLRRGMSYAALIPWLIFFAVSAITGVVMLRRFFVISFIASCLLFLFSDSWVESSQTASWYGAFGRIAEARRSRPRFRSAFRLGTISILGGLLLPGVVPGFGANPIIEMGGTVTASRIEISPFVQIRPRLSLDAERVMFTVEADRPSYWKLASLNSFDGDTWQLKGNFARSGSNLRLRRPPSGITESLRQVYEIQALGGAWVPAAYAPVRVRGLRFLADPDRDTLLVDSLKDGQRYEVVSNVPAPDFDSLRSAPAGEVGPQYLALPATLDPVIGEIARSVSEQATSLYEKALAIQSYLAGFTYDEDVPAGHSDDYLVEFLTVTKAGYCEQFAGSMAVMLRTLGIPSRVAVGFLPGNPTAEGFVVTNRDAHAWPEAYFEGIGWMGFEPTPRSGVIPPPATGVTPIPVTTPNFTAPVGPQPGQPPIPPEDLQEPQPRVPEPPSSPVIDIARRATARVLIATVLILFLISVGRQLVIRLPYALARSPAERVEATFFEFLTRAQDAYRIKAWHETEMEFVASATAALNLSRTATGELVGTYHKAAYSASGPDPSQESRARRAGIELRRALWRRAGWLGKLRLALSPRPVKAWLQFALPARWLVMRASSAARNV